MTPFVFLPYFTLHGLTQHVFMEAYAPFYRAFDRSTKHAWVGRMNSLAVQLLALPVLHGLSMEEACIHILGLYILHDCFHCAIYEPDPMNWIHHAVTLAGYTYTFWAPPDHRSLMLAGSLILESTAPLLHICWFANKAGYAKRPWFPVLAGTTVAVYGLVRCLYFPYFFATSAPAWGWPVGVFFTVMNWVWFYKLIGYARAVLRKAGGSRTE